MSAKEVEIKVGRTLVDVYRMTEKGPMKIHHGVIVQDWTSFVRVWDFVSKGADEERQENAQTYPLAGLKMFCVQTGELKSSVQIAPLWK